VKIAMIGQKGVPATYGGIERHVEELATRLVQRGHEVSVYCRTHYTRTRGTHRGVHLIRHPTIRTKHMDAISHCTMASFDALFREFDIVHFHALGPSLFALLPRAVGKRSVVSIHGLDWQREKWGRFARSFLKFCEGPAVRFPDRTIVVSKTLRAYFADRFSIEPVFIPNGTPIPERRPPAKLKRFGLHEGRYVLFVGRLVPEKGCHFLVEAFNRLETDAKLVMVGGSSFSSDYVASIQRMCKQNERIVMMDYVYGDLLEELWSNAYFVVHPSVLEGLSIALLEALSFGKCVLVSDIPENLEVAESCAITFRSRDVDHLEARMRALLDDEALVGSFEVRCREHIRENYSWDVVVDAVERVYAELLDSTGEGAPADRGLRNGAPAPSAPRDR
jgi:glycosyltransferase involved in cell wall biosynthesis